MHLTLVISGLTAGGAERVLSTLANAWVSRGHRVDLITTHDAGVAPHFKLLQGINLQSVDPRSPGPLKQVSIVRALRHTIRDRRPDIVVSFLSYTNVITLLASRGLGIPVVVSERTDPRIQTLGWAWSLLRRFSYRSASFLVAQTETAAMNYRFLAPIRVRVIPNPVLPQGGDHATSVTRPRSPSPTILAMGRLHPIKGFDLAIRAMALLPREMQNWRLEILGEGPARADLEQLRDRLGLGDRVAFMGVVQDTRPWLRDASLFLLPSRSEGFPNALCEAMAAGLPVIATDCPSGPSDIITPDIDGILVPCGDYEAIAKGLIRLIADEQLRSEIAAQAPHILERYSLDNVLAAWDSVFEVAMAHPHESSILGLPLDRR